MNPRQALQILTEIGISFKGTLQDHQNIQTALGIVDALTQNAEANRFVKKNAERTPVDEPAAVPEGFGEKVEEEPQAEASPSASEPETPQA